MSSQDLADENAAFYGHSRDFDFDVRGAEKLAQVERDLGIRSMLEHLVKAGWSGYQWRNSPAGRKSFIEATGPAYSDFRRADSTVGVKQAVESLVNRVQAVLRCEQSVGHDFTARAGYENGVLACRHCGFGGYTSLFQHRESERADWARQLEQAREKLGALQARLGINFNVADEVLIANRQVLGKETEDGFTVVSDTDRVSFVITSEGGSDEPVVHQVEET